MRGEYVGGEYVRLGSLSDDCGASTSTFAASPRLYQMAANATRMLRTNTVVVILLSFSRAAGVALCLRVAVDFFVLDPIGVRSRIATGTASFVRWRSRMKLIESKLQREIAEKRNVVRLEGSSEDERAIEVWIAVEISYNSICG